MRNRTAREGAVQIFRSDIAFALVQQLDVAAQRDGCQAILGSIGVFADAREQGLSEAYAEAQYLEAEFLCDPVVPEFMYRHQDAYRNQEGSRDKQKLHAKAPCAGSINVFANRRAAASASKTSPRALTGDALSRCSTLSMTVEIPTKFKRRSRKA